MKPHQLDADKDAVLLAVVDLVILDAEDEQGNRGGRGHNRNTPRQTRNNSRMIALTNGTQIEFHALFKFPRHVYLKMKQEDKDTLKRERALYKQN
jgi:hypothetical protein